MGIGRIMAIEAGRGVDGRNWSGGYWEPRKTSTGFPLVFKIRPD